MAEEIQEAEQRVETLKRELSEAQNKLDCLANDKSANERIHPLEKSGS